jgi:hypothetical protein
LHCMRSHQSKFYGCNVKRLVFMINSISLSTYMISSYSLCLWLSAAVSSLRTFTTGKSSCASPTDHQKAIDQLKSTFPEVLVVFGRTPKPHRNILNTLYCTGKHLLPRTDPSHSRLRHYLGTDVIPEIRDLARGMATSRQVKQCPHPKLPMYLSKIDVVKL